MIKFSDTLTSLDLYVLTPQIYCVIQNNLKVLKYLKVSRFGGDFGKMQFQPNKTITDFHLSLNFETLSSAQKKFMRSLINLEKLSFTGINDLNLQWIKKNLRYWKHLKIVEEKLGKTIHKSFKVEDLIK